jgi:hypothetical protein
MPPDPTHQPPPCVWPHWLTRRETAEYLWVQHGIKFGVAALAKGAMDSSGPAFHKQGGKLVSYLRVDVDEWASLRSRRVRSTSELAPRQGRETNTPPKSQAA